MTNELGGSGACSEYNQWDWGTKSLKFCISTLSFSLNSLKISQIKPRKVTFKQTSQLTAHNVLWVTYETETVCDHSLWNLGATKK